METTLFADDGPRDAADCPLVPKAQTEPFSGHKQGLGSAGERFHGQLGREGSRSARR